MSSRSDPGSGRFAVDQVNLLVGSVDAVVTKEIRQDPPYHEPAEIRGMNVVSCSSLVNSVRRERFRLNTPGNHQSTMRLADANKSAAFTARPFRM